MNHLPFINNNCVLFISDIIMAMAKFLLLANNVHDIKGSKLPSNKQVLGIFLHLHQQQGQTVCNSASRTVEKVVDVE